MQIEEALLYWIVRDYYIGRLEVQLPIGLRDVGRWVLHQNTLRVEQTQISDYVLISRFSKLERFGQRYAKLYAIGTDKPSPDIFQQALDSMSQSYLMDRMFHRQATPLLDTSISQHRIYALENIDQLLKFIQH